MKTARNFWPVGIIIFFTAFFVGIAVVIVIASTHQDTLVNDNYYEQELKFQDQIDATERAAKCGAKIRYDSAAGKILLALPAEQAGQSVSGKVSFYRANAPALDCDFPMQLNSDGTQTIEISKLANGPWKICARWKADGKDYYLEEKVIK